MVSDWGVVFPSAVTAGHEHHRVRPAQHTVDYVHLLNVLPVEIAPGALREWPAIALGESAAAISKPGNAAAASAESAIGIPAKL